MSEKTLSWVPCHLKVAYNVQILWQHFWNALAESWSADMCSANSIVATLLEETASGFIFPSFCETVLSKLGHVDTPEWCALKAKFPSELEKVLSPADLSTWALGYFRLLVQPSQPTLHLTYLRWDHFNHVIAALALRHPFLSHFSYVLNDGENHPSLGCFGWAHTFVYISRMFKPDAL